MSRVQPYFIGDFRLPGDLSDAEAKHYIVNKVIAAIPAQLLAPNTEGALRDSVLGAAEEIIAAYDLCKKIKASP